MRRRGLIALLACVIVSASLLLGTDWCFVLTGGSATAAAQQRADESGKRLGLRLRSFVPNASGSLYFEPTVSGGTVRLTALGLPNPQTLMPNANAYLVWAVAPGESPIRVGELKVDRSGNGGLEFARPASFERYSVLTTAEASDAAQSPLGVMVFATRAGAVAAFYGEKDKAVADSRKKSLEREMDRRARRSKRGTTDFYAEVDQALDASGGGRTLELYGEEVAPDAHGIARVTARNENLYVRALINRLPIPTMAGASTYVQWSVMPDGRIVYMGSLPTMNLDNSDIYVRVAGFSSDDIDLFVTAERQRPVARPSGLRAVSSRSLKDISPQFGAIEGRVLDTQGNPIAGAKVDTYPLDRPDASAPPITYVAYTDEKGRFFLDGVLPGRHMVYASKEDQGYPDTFFAFFVADPEAVPKVSVSDKQVTQGVDIRLGEKAAKLVGRVMDARTGQPVEDAEIIFYRADNPSISYTTGPNESEGRFRRLIPSIPFKIKVSAPGYEDWYYRKEGAQDQADVLLLAPNAVEELNISLRPAR